LFTNYGLKFNFEAGTSENLFDILEFPIQNLPDVVENFMEGIKKTD